MKIEKVYRVELHATVNVEKLVFYVLLCILAARGF